MRSPPVHCASHKCIGHCADFRALPVAMLPALVQALLRSPPALRPALPRAVRSAPPATQSPWRLRSAGFPGVDLPIFHTARIAYPTGRAGLGFHTRRSMLLGVPYGPMSCLFGAFRGQTGSCVCWTERISHRYTRILIVLSPHGRSCPAPTYARTRKKTTDIRPTYAEFGCGDGKGSTCPRPIYAGHGCSSPLDHGRRRIDRGRAHPANQQPGPRGMDAIFVSGQKKARLARAGTAGTPSGKPACRRKPRAS